jgi:aminoglycoside phosphotransferase (APT) family kinase protein
MSARACRTLLDRRIVQTTVLAETHSSTVVRAIAADGGSVIVKLYGAERGRRAWEEQRALTAAGTLVPVPQVLAYGPLPDTETTALIIADLGQVDLGDAVRDGRCTRTGALAVLGSLLALLHQLPMNAGPYPPTTRGPHTDASPLLRRCPRPLAAIGPTLTQAAVGAATSTRPVWCHGDLHPANVLFPYVSPGQLGPAYMIDLGQMVCAAPEYDVAQCLVVSDALTPTERAHVECAYGPGLDRSLLDDLIVFHAVRGWVYAAAAEGRDIPLWNARIGYVLRHHPSIV